MFHLHQQATSVPGRCRSVNSLVVLRGGVLGRGAHSREDEMRVMGRSNLQANFERGTTKADLISEICNVERLGVAQPISVDRS